MSKYLAWGLSFFVGAAVMILELTASRAMAPILGSSLYTWTAVIGVVLVGLSLGAYIGGKMIDRYPQMSVLRNLFFLAGFSVCVMMLLGEVMPTIALLPLSIPILATFISTVLFFLPATLLGAVQPMVVKLSTAEVEHLGGAYGTLSALWSLGSIVGVFLSGFYLIPLLGTWKTFLLVAIILFLAGLSLSRMRVFPVFLLVALLVPVWFFARPIGPHVLYAKDTGYFRALVAEADIQPFGLSRIFFLDIDTHSIKRGTSTVPIYTDLTRLLSPTLTATSNILVIGGGAYTMPNDLAAKTPSAVEVFDLDPEVPGIIRTFFSIDPKILTTIGDARHLLLTSTRTYDLIIGDSFNSFISVPWHLLTQEWNAVVKQHLSDGGIYAVNIITTRAGEGSDLYEAVDKTLRQDFPFVEAYGFATSPLEIQNVVFLASRTPLDEMVTRGAFTKVIPGLSSTFEDLRVKTLPIAGMILTDDHAPTDTMLLPIAQKALPSSIGLYYGMTQVR